MANRKVLRPTPAAAEREPQDGDRERIASVATPKTFCGQAAPLRIEIEPTTSGRKWIARLGDRVLLVSAWPFVKSARLLMQESYLADALAEVWHRNADEWAMRGRLGAVAETLIDGETATRCAKNGSPVRFPGMGATPAQTAP